MTEVRRNWGTKNLRTRGLVFSNAFSPYEIENLAEWKRADQKVTIASGNSVSAVGDLADGPSWVAASGHYPALGTDSHLGSGLTPCFTFDKTTQLFTYTGVTLGAATTIVVIGYVASVASIVFGGTAHALSIQSQNLGRWSWVNGSDAKQMSPPVNVGFVAVVRQTDGANIVGRQNGIQQFTATPATALAGKQFLSVGADFNSTSFSDAPIAEHVIYTSALSDNDLRRLEKYAALRYGLAVS